jgi:Tfp pilus assembly protein FimV
MGRSARRVRLAAIAVALAIGFMFGSMVEAFEMPSSVEPSSDVPAARQSAATVVVMPGDSLWSIARVHAPEGMDVRKYVHALRKANGLEGSVLHAGQTLVLP